MQSRIRNVGSSLDALYNNDSFKILLKDFFETSILNTIYDGGSDKTIVEETTSRYIFKNYLDTIQSDFQELIKNEK